MSRTGPSADPEPETGADAMVVRLRLRERPGALERALGFIRRRGLAPHGVEVTSGDGDVRLAARIAPRGRTAARIRAELSSLHDALDIDIEEPSSPPPPVESA